MDPMPYESPRARDRRLSTEARLASARRRRRRRSGVRLPPGASRVGRAGLGVAATLAVFAGSAGVARANPGTPNLYNVPSFVLADDGSAGAPGSTKPVTFGWGEVALDADEVSAYYGLCAQDTAGPLTCASAEATGNTEYAGSATLPLVDGHAYDVYVYVREAYCLKTFPFLCGTLSTYGPSLRTVADFVAPSAGALTINGGARYTNRLTVSVAAGGGWDGASGVGSAQVGTDLALPCSLIGFLPTCPFSLSGGAGTKAVDLATPDGLKFVWGRMRDRADHPAVSLYAFRNPTPGNPSALAAASITVDTTPPVPALASATLTGVAGRAVSFDASATTDSGSGVDPQGFVWTFGDGTTATGAATMAHVYPGPGSYTGRVVAHDRSGHNGAPADTNFASLPFTVTVSPAPVAPPTGPPPPPGGTPPVGTPPGGTPPVGTPGGTPPPTTPPPAPAPRGHAGGILRAVSLVGRPTSGHAFTVDVRLGAATTVSAVLRNAAGHVVQRLSRRARAGTAALRLRGRKAGRYALTVSSGSVRKTIAIRIRS